MKTQKQLLKALLIDLIVAQDNVTHMNEKGTGYEHQTLELIETRTLIMNNIIVFVEKMPPYKGTANPV